MLDPNSNRPHFIALALGATLAACSNGVVDLGGGPIEQPVDVGSRCLYSTIVYGDVRVKNQIELDALLGCEEIQGSLQIDVFEGTDLAPLARLRAVDGNLFIGGVPDPPLDASEEAYVAWQIEVDRALAITEAGWLDSLAGVESLERVGGLLLFYISAPSLEAFASLRLVSSAADAPGQAGRVSIISAFSLVDLGALENVRGYRTIEISQNPTLESLHGLVVPSWLDSLWLEGSPALTDIDALLSLENVVFNVDVSGIGVANLDALANLKWTMEGVIVHSNPALIDVDALQALQRAELLEFSYNPKLERLPEFSNLLSLDDFRVTGNPALESIALNFTRFQDFNYVNNTDTPTAVRMIEVGDNAQLQSVAFKAGLRAAQVLSINHNDRLDSIDLGGLKRLDRLDLLSNAALTEVALGSLQTIDSLSVIGNSSLSTTELRTVRSFESVFLDNADDPPPSP